MHVLKDFSLTIFKDRYAFTPEETWEEACGRVARQAAMAETPDKQKNFETRFQSVLVKNQFVPGGRIWYNSGRSNPNLLNCFVLDPKKDSKEGWGNSARNMIVTSMHGGGCGDDFSDIRPRGATISGQKGEAPGAVELMRLLDGCAEPVRNGGQRRVALMHSLDLDHPDIEEFLSAKLVKGELTHANVSVRSKNTKHFIKAVKNDEDWELSWKGKYKRTVKARDIWNTIVTNAYNSAEPGFLNWELGEEESNIYYITELVTTNPCVSGDTEILTPKGYVRIDSVVNQQIEIWNGFEWSTVTPKITGTNRPMLKISFSDGRELTCTEYHGFKIIDGASKEETSVMAKDLKGGMQLIRSEYPVIEEGLELKNAYTMGFVSAEGMEEHKTLWVYPPKKECIPRLEGVKSIKWEEDNNRYRISLEEKSISKDFVPLNYDLKSKLAWLSGLFDGDGHELISGGLQLSSVNRAFLGNLQKLLATLGVPSKVLLDRKAQYRVLPDGRGGNASYFCKENHRICISAMPMQRLKKLGLACERVDFKKNPKRDFPKFVKVTDVVYVGVHEKVYCFTEPKRGLGLFNGVLTANCGEVALSAFDCCCLGHIVLSRFVKDGQMDWHELANVVRLGVRFLDNILTVNNYPMQEMKETSHKLRRIGLGTTALADMLALLNLKYGSEEGNKFLDKLFRFISKAAYESSIMLAVEKGAFPECIPAKHVESGYMKRMPEKIKALVRENGIRNCAILTQAPTGTVSIISGNCSSGIEPMFAPAYERRYWKNDKRETELVFHPLFAEFMKEGRDVSHFVGARDLSVRDHLEVQKIVQKHIDNAVSKTINIPEDYPIEDMASLWLEYLPHLKGTTFYRENTRGFINDKGEKQEPPLTALSLEEAKAKYNSEVTLGKDDTDCPGGVCEF